MFDRLKQRRSRVAVAMPLHRVIMSSRDRQFIFDDDHAVQCRLCPLLLQ
jgi:hypothetical protein